MKVRVRRIRGSVDDTEPLRLDFPQRRGTPEGVTQVQVQTKDGSGTWTESGWALLHVARYDSVMTVRDRIREGEAVTPSQLETAWIETTDFNGEPMRDSDFRARLADGSLVATQMLRPGQVLRKREVRPPYAADTGTSIDMQYVRGRFILRLACKAREPGFMEKVIRVYCPDTKTTYRARVTGDGTARWIETL